MTNQEAFDTMSRHLLTQGAKSLDESGKSCRYRGNNGMKCAVGAIIPDRDYDEALEGLPAHDVAVFIPRFGGLDTYVLEDVQFVHDYLDPGVWREKLRDVAKRWDLSPAVLDEFGDESCDP